MSNSVRPHRRQPTRLPRPWDSPGKNTGVGCHFLLQCMKVKSESEVSQSCLTLTDLMDCSFPGSSVHGIFQARVLEWGAIAFFMPLILRGFPGDSAVKSLLANAGVLVTQSSSTLLDPIDCRLLCAWNFPGKNTGVGSHFFLQRIFPTQGSNLGLPHGREAL